MHTPYGRDRTEQAQQSPPIMPVSRDGELPLSFAQQRLWFMDQLQPGIAAYNIPLAVRLRGPLNVTALEQSINGIVCRHESLRTSFATVGGSPVQVIAPNLSVTLLLMDLSELPKDEREVETQRLAVEEVQHPFNLAQGPLVRTTLLRLDEEEHVLLLTMHHIISDGWSIEVFLRELLALYQAFIEGQPSPPLPGLAIQYVDYALWQREWLQGEVLEKQLAYWMQQLSGAPTVLELPADRPRPSFQTFRGSRQSLVLSKSLTEELEALSRQEGVTLFMTLLAAFQTLLYRYTGQEDLLVGSPIAGRTRVETEGLIGFFVNTLVMRADLSGNQTFRQFLGQARQVALDAYAHQDVPFEKIVESLQPERDLSHTPLFQVMFRFRNVPNKSLEQPGLRVEDFEFDSGVAQFDLILDITEKAEGLSCSLKYNSDLFDAARMGRMLGHYRNLLAGAVANPDAHLSALPLLTEGERHQLLGEWNDTHTEYPKECIHKVFEEQVRRTPEAVAVVFEGQRLTYGELNTRANRVAQYLRRRGVGPEVLVGVCVERSLEMVVWLLGVLKAGGAYVPLDPAYPAARLRFMLEDSGARLLLTQQPLLQLLPESRAEVLCLDRDWAEVSQESAENPAPRPAAENLAYVIYTSGSTGRPKGVAVTHRSAAALVAWARGGFTEEELGGVLASTSICFDLSVFEIFVPLSCGGTVLLAENVLQLPHLASAKDVRLINTVPSAMVELLRLGGLPGGVRTVNLAGEPLPDSLVEQIYAQPQVERILDLYGPSEDTTYSTWARRLAGGPATIGRPVSNTRVYLLDGHLRPVPVGVPGELHVGGAGLARGYLNRPELTAERFIPDPFGRGPDERLYKTGDLARYLPDGNIEFLGRRDRQVKIRGFRIELGEVEAALSQHAAVRQSVVIVREDAPGEKHLVGYIVPHQEQPPSNSELRAYLKEKLPEYMVPSGFVLMDKLPLTESGKVDHRALPAPDAHRPESDQAFVAPRDHFELQLTHIWEEALGKCPVGVRDDFFELGGHSLLAVRLFARVEERFGRHLPLDILFRSPTVERMADVLRQEASSTASSSLVAVQPGGSKPPFFCVPAAAMPGLVFAPLARYMGKDQPFYGLTPPSQELAGPSTKWFERMAEHYIEVMRELQPEGPYYLGGMCFGGIVAFEMAQQLVKQGERVALLAIMDTGPFLSASLSTLTYKHKIKILVGRAAARVFRTFTRRQSFGPVLEREVADSITEQQFNRIREVMHMHRRAAECYTQRLYPGRITLIQSEEYSTMEKFKWGWSMLAAGGLDCHVVTGKHNETFLEPNLQSLAQTLKTCLDKAQANGQR